MKLEMFSTDFRNKKYSKVNKKKSVQWKPRCYMGTEGRTDRQTDMKLTVAFSDFGNAPKYKLVSFSEQHTSLKFRTTSAITGKVDTISYRWVWVRNGEWYPWRRNKFCCRLVSGFRLDRHYLYDKTGWNSHTRYGWTNATLEK